MSKELVEKKEEKLTLFEMMDRIFDNERKRMEQIREQMNRSIFNIWNFERQPVIKMENIEDFQKSIEAYKQANPDATITARAYTFSSTNPEENKVFEYSEQEKLPEKQKMISHGKSKTNPNDPKKPYSETNKKPKKKK